MLRKLEKLLGAGWLTYGGILWVYYLWRFFAGTLDGVSLVIASVEGVLGVVAGILLLASLAGKSIAGVLVSLVEGFREFFYVFHTWPVDLNPDTVRGFVVLLWAIATLLLVLSTLAGRARAARGLASKR